MKDQKVYLLQPVQKLGEPPIVVSRHTYNHCAKGGTTEVPQPSEPGVVGWKALLSLGTLPSHFEWFMDTDNKIREHNLHTQG